MNQITDVDRGLLADDVLQYLSHHQKANDTVEGIVAWWRTQQRFRYAVSDVETALDELVEFGLVIAQEAPDGRVHYQMNPQMKDVIFRHRDNSCYRQTPLG